jgi:hypothetical protein
MDDPQHLRAHAVRLYALAVKVRDVQPAYADMLFERSKELQREATAIEEAARPVPPSDAPQPPSQLQEQTKPEKNDK